MNFTSEESLKKCPCGQFPTSLLIQPDTSTGGKWAWVQGDCCSEWAIEFRLGYIAPDSPEAQALAFVAWNEAPRPNMARFEQVYRQYEHLDGLLSNLDGSDDFRLSILSNLWQAVKSALP